MPTCDALATFASHSSDQRFAKELPGDESGEWVSGKAQPERAPDMPERHWLARFDRGATEGDISPHGLEGGLHMIFFPNRNIASDDQQVNHISRNPAVRTTDPEIR